MYILGISAFYHDSAAALVKDGKLIFAAEEERYSRVKHSYQFPTQAAKAALDYSGISIQDINYIAYYEKPLLRFERVLDTITATFPTSLGMFTKAIPEWLGEKIRVEAKIRKLLGFKGKIYYVPHHLSHAAAAYYSSGFTESAILTIDGIGEYQTAGLWHAKNGQITNLGELNFPNSLGLLYSTFTAFLGFRINEDEYKVMGLAAYGKPKYAGDIYKIVSLKSNGSFEINMKYFAFHKKFKMWNQKFEELFGKPRHQEQAIKQIHKDLAASLQQVTEKVINLMLNHLNQITQTNNLCMGGGVALNALENGKIYNQTPFKNTYIFGPAGDGGSALGAAQYLHFSILKKWRHAPPPIHSLAVGSKYDHQQIAEELMCQGLKFKRFQNSNEVAKHTARLLKNGKIIGWFQDRMEYGPRALGSRSILADPRTLSMRAKLNKLKRRRNFQPFGASVLQNKAHKYFELPKRNMWSGFMLFCFQVLPRAKSQIPALVHADGSCRIHTVGKEAGIYYRLIVEFSKLTGIDCLINTSFNQGGEPIVESPAQAIATFKKCELDYLVIGKFIVAKASGNL